MKREDGPSGGYGGKSLRDAKNTIAPLSRPIGIDWMTHCLDDVNEGIKGNEVQWAAYLCSVVSGPTGAVFEVISNGDLI